MNQIGNNQPTHEWKHKMSQRVKLSIGVELHESHADLWDEILRRSFVSWRIRSSELAALREGVRLAAQYIVHNKKDFTYDVFNRALDIMANYAESETPTDSEEGEF